jgi:hypothetical protein
MLSLIEKEWDMKRIAVLLMVALMVTVLPVAAGALTDEEAAALLLLGEKIDALDGADAAEWAAAFDEVETALAALKGALPDLDYGDVDAAVAALGDAIEGGDISEMEAAAAVLAGEFAALETAADAGETPEGGVSTGGGGTAGNDPLPFIMLGIAALVLAVPGAYYMRQRSQN